MPPVVTGVDLPPPRGRGCRGCRGHFFSFLSYLWFRFAHLALRSMLSCQFFGSSEWAVVRVRRDNGAVQDVKL